MKDVMRQIRDFHFVMGVRHSKTPTLPDNETRTLRRTLIEEEVKEYFEAEEKNDLTEIAKELADIVVVVAGCADVYGIPFEKVFEAVHKSNMAKAPGGKVKRREDGKILKPDGWKPPDIKRILSGASIVEDE